MGSDNIFSETCFNPDKQQPISSKMKKEREQQQPTEANNDLYTLLGTERNFNWEKFKAYVNTYDMKRHSTNDKCTFEDMLYGLAIAIDDKYWGFLGYREFKKHLKEWLKQFCTQLRNRRN